MAKLSTATPDPARSVMQLKVTLRFSRPPIWRRLAVPADIKLPRLHEVLQSAFGWTNSHLHAFRVGQDHYEPPSPVDLGGDIYGMEPRLDYRKVRLSDLLHAKGDRLVYEYDFGDSWEHEVRVEKILPAAKRLDRAQCLAGALAGPPEDCGGIPGYYQLLETLADPKHPEHAHLKEWLGGDLDPTTFDAAAVNATLLTLRV